MPEMSEQEMRGMAWDNVVRGRENYKRKKDSLRKQRVYVGQMSLNDLDAAIRTAEYMLDLIGVSYEKKKMTEIAPQRSKRSDYLVELLSVAELRY